MRIGVLALQGDFAEVTSSLQSLGVAVVQVKKPQHLQALDGLIIPGGESTVIGNLLEKQQLLTILKEKIQKGLPVLGICAGLILLCDKVAARKTPAIRLLDARACRNAYGRQLGSFCQQGKFLGKEIPMIFIRGPYLTDIGSEVTVLARLNGKIVAAKHKNIFVTAFHPELCKESTVLSYFLTEAKDLSQKQELYP